MEKEKVNKNTIIIEIVTIIIFVIVGFYMFSANQTTTTTNTNTTNTTNTDNKDSHAISCAKSALTDYAKYDPEIGTTKILEKDNYGRYLIECYAKLVNAFGTGKYDTYYIIIYDVHEENGEWYYRYNKANGIYGIGTIGPNAKELLKEINNWGEDL